MRGLRSTVVGITIKAIHRSSNSQQVVASDCNALQTLNCYEMIPSPMSVTWHSMLMAERYRTTFLCRGHAVLPHVSDFLLHSCVLMDPVLTHSPSSIKSTNLFTQALMLRCGALLLAQGVTKGMYIQNIGFQTTVKPQISSSCRRFWNINKRPRFSLVYNITKVKDL